MAFSTDTTTISIIKTSLEHELLLLQSRCNLLESEIEFFEKKYKISSKEFKEKFEKGDLGDDQDFFEWWGLLRGFESSKEKLKTVERTLVSS